MGEALRGAWATKFGPARRERIMRQWPGGRPQALEHLDRDAAPPCLIGGNIRLSNPGSSGKLCLAQAGGLSKRSNWIHHGRIISHDMTLATARPIWTQPVT